MNHKIQTYPDEQFENTRQSIILKTANERILGAGRTHHGSASFADDRIDIKRHEVRYVFHSQQHDRNNEQ